ncbi:MAG: hypothetical protein VXV96_06850 [Bdellovibrionota bacterium]|nr:hypothetical protein [Bdellovibrionota bacterium]
MEFYHRNDRAIKSLVELAALGYYPLFEEDWLNEVWSEKPKNLTGNEKAKAKTLFKRLCEHRSLERQRTVFWAMKEEDRVLFKRAFLKMVETKILDTSPELQ